MIRTTVRLEDSTFKEARKKAIDNGISFTNLVNQALKNYLKLKPASKKSEFKIYNMGKIKGNLSRLEIYEDLG